MGFTLNSKSRPFDTSGDNYENMYKFGKNVRDLVFVCVCETQRERQRSG